MSSQAPVTERVISTALRDREAAKLREDGLSYQQIADTMGCSISTAHTMVRRALREAVREPGQAVLELELRRLDRALQIAQEIADDTSAGPLTRLAAIDRITKLSESRRKLQGLDAPTKVEHRVVDALDAQLEQLASELGAMSAPVSRDDELEELEDAR